MHTQPTIVGASSRSHDRVGPHHHPIDRDSIAQPNSGPSSDPNADPSPTPQPAIGRDVAHTFRGGIASVLGGAALSTVLALGSAGTAHGQCGTAWMPGCFGCCEWIGPVCVLPCLTCVTGNVLVAGICIPEELISGGWECILNPCDTGCFAECNPLCAQFNPNADCVCPSGTGIDPFPDGPCSPCWIGNPGYFCIGDGRGQVGQQAWKLNSAEMARVHNLRRCDHGLKIGNEVDCFFSNDCLCVNDTRFNSTVSSWHNTSWEAKAVRKWQRMISRNMPITQIFMLGSHNSYHNLADQYQGFSHEYSISDQLRLGVRYITLDAHWWPQFDQFPNTELRLTHAHFVEAFSNLEPDMPVHQGMALSDRPFRHALEEIRAWLLQNPEEFIVIDIDNWSQGEWAHITNALELAFGNLLFRPSTLASAFDGDWSQVTPAQLIGSGGPGRVIVICNGLPAGQNVAFASLGNETIGDDAVKSFLDNWQYNPQTGYAGPSAPWQSPSGYLRFDQLTRFTGNSFYHEATAPWSGVFDGPATVGTVQPNHVRAMAQAGVNVAMLDPIGKSAAGLPKYALADLETSAFELAAASIWSWDVNEPSGSGTVAIARLSGGNTTLRFRAVSANGPVRPFAMQSLNGKCWRISSFTAGSFSLSGNAPEILVGYAFAAPGNGYEMERLRREMIAAGVNEVWVNLFRTGAVDADGDPVWFAETIPHDPDWHDLDAPAAEGDSFTLLSMTAPSTIPAPGVLANDMLLTIACTSQPLRATTANSMQPQYGTVAMSADGGFTYTPGPDFTGIDVFGYRTYFDHSPNMLSDEATVVVSFAAHDRFVSPAGSSGNDGLSPATALNSIQSAINSAPPGVVNVWLAPGTYTGTVTINRPAVTIRGAGHGATILSGNTVQRVVNVQSGGQVTLEDLQIVNGRGGVQIAAGGSATIERCVLTGHSANQQEQIGVAIRNLGSLVLRHSTISGNTQTFLPGGIGQPPIPPLGASGIFAASTATTVIESSTIVGNQVIGQFQNAAGGLLRPSGSAAGNSITNSVFAGNVGGFGDVFAFGFQSTFNIYGSGVTNFGQQDLLNADAMLGPLADHPAPGILFPSPFTVSSTPSLSEIPAVVGGAPDGDGIALADTTVLYDLGGAYALDGPGADIIVYATPTMAVAFDDAEFDVRVSADGVVFTSIASTLSPALALPGDEAHGAPSLARGFDFAASGLSAVRFIEVTGTIAGGATPLSLDAIGVRYAEVPGRTLGHMPLFVSSTEFSPAIDSGSPIAGQLRDQRGVIRPLDGIGDGIARLDRGALEFSDGPEPVFGDLNGDGVVDGADLGVLLNAWGACPPNKWCSADLNGDGVVDGADLGLLLNAWGG